MNKSISMLFDTKEFKELVAKNIPNLLWKADMIHKKHGAAGPKPDVGTSRERIIVTLLEHFTDDVVEVDENEADVKVNGGLCSIKTLTDKSAGISTGFKLKWTANYESVKDVYDNYKPSCDIIFLRLGWGRKCHLYFIPLEVQEHTFNTVKDKSEYIYKPKKTDRNVRGIPIKAKILRFMVDNYHIDVNKVFSKDNVHYYSSTMPRVMSISVPLRIPNIKFDPKKIWRDGWNK